MAEITPAALIARLMDVCEARTVEDLARKLNVPYRQVQNYKAGKGMKFDRTIEFLERAGWLSIDGAGRSDGAAPRDPLKRLAQSLTRLEKGQAAILELLTPPQEQRQAEGRPRPKGPRRT